MTPGCRPLPTAGPDAGRRTPLAKRWRQCYSALQGPKPGILGRKSPGWHSGHSRQNPNLLTYRQHRQFQFCPQFCPHVPRFVLLSFCPRNCSRTKGQNFICIFVYNYFYYYFVRGQSADNSDKTLYNYTCTYRFNPILSANNFI